MLDNKGKKKKNVPNVDRNKKVDFVEELSKFVLEEDQEGFCKSFEISQEKEIKEFFQKYGIVVVKDVVDEEQIQRTIDEIWNSPTILGFYKQKGLKRDDPSTYDIWPAKMLSDKGFMTNIADLNLKQCWENRQNPKLYSLYSNLLDNKELFVVFDRYGFMRPTKNIQFGNGKVEDREKWRTNKSWLHCDQNFWDEPGFHRVKEFYL